MDVWLTYGLTKKLIAFVKSDKSNSLKRLDNQRWKEIWAEQTFGQ